MEELELLVFEVGDELLDMADICLVHPSSLLLALKPHPCPLTHLVSQARTPELEPPSMSRPTLII